MKKTIRLIGLAALVALPAISQAQTTRPVTFGVSGGLSAPMGNLGDFVDAGYNVTGHIWFKPASLNSLGFRGDVSYDNWKYKVGNVNARNLGVTGNIILQPSARQSSVVPYFIGGGGLFSGKSYTANNSSVTSSDLGVQAGGGIEFRLAGFSTFAEVKFVNVFSDNESTNWVPITFGIKF